MQVIWQSYSSLETLMNLFKPISVDNYDKVNKLQKTVFYSSVGVNCY